jgi:hypothetical protein
MTKHTLGSVLLLVLIVGALLGGAILIGFDVSSFDEFWNVLKSIWFALLGILGS